MSKLIILFFLLPVFSMGQLSQEDSIYLDSLHLEIKHAEHDSTIIKCWKKWDNLIYAFDADLDYALNKRIDSVCTVNLNSELTLQERYFFAKAKGTALNILGIIHRGKSEFDVAIEYHQESIIYSKMVNDQAGIANAFSNLGNIYNDRGDYQKAIAYQMRSLKIEELRDDPEGIAACLNNIGIVYEKLEEFEKAINYYERSLKLKEEIGHQSGIANSLNNLGVVYELMEKYDSALTYHQRSLEIEIASNNYYGISRSYSNIAEVYRDQGYLKESIEYYDKALELQTEIGDIYGEASTLLHKGLVLDQIGKTDEAILLLEKAVKLSQEIGAILSIDQASEALYIIYKRKGNNFKALEMHEIHVAAKDSAFNENNKKEIIRQEYKYAYDKQATADSIRNVEAMKTKDAQLQLEKAESEKQRIQSYYLYGGVGLLVFFGLFISNRYRVTRQQRDVIQMQKKEVSHAYDQLEEKNTEILDSIEYAKRIQLAILPPLKTVKKNLPDSFVLYKPKDIVAGDFYWMQEQNDDLIFAVADCTGHGVPGAMVSVICNNGLNRSVREYKLTNPGEILDSARKIVIQEFEKSEEEVYDGMDIAICRIPGGLQSIKEDGSCLLQYAGAHNPIWIIRNGASEIEEIKANKQHIGKFRQQEAFTTHEITLYKGDQFYIFSDGYADQFGGEKGRKFKTKNFKALLLEISKKNMDEQKVVLDQRFEDWKGALEQIDDVCVIGVRV